MSDVEPELRLPRPPPLSLCVRCHRPRRHHAKGQCAACYARAHQRSVCIDGRAFNLPQRDLPSPEALRRYIARARRRFLDDVLAHPRTYLNAVPILVSEVPRA